MSPFEGHTLLRTNGFPLELETDETRIQRVRENILFVRVHGNIRYRDVFGNQWQLKFCRVWKYWSWYTGKEAVGGMWGPAGNVGDDDHRQVN